MIPSVLPTYNRAPLNFVKGEGSWLEEADGRRFIDLGAGIAVNALGHAHPALVAALTEQAGKLWHVSNLYNITQQQALADKLVLSKLRARLGLDRAFALLSGSAPLDPGVHTFFLACGLDLLEAYGLTETCAGPPVQAPSDLRCALAGAPTSARAATPATGKNQLRYPPGQAQEGGWAACHRGRTGGTLRLNRA